MTQISLMQANAAPDAPVACTLTAAEHRERTRQLSAVARHALTSRERIDGGARLTFADDPHVERELRAAVAAERSCCAFLTMRLLRRDHTLLLDVTGPRDAAPIIEELFA